MTGDFDCCVNGEHDRQGTYTIETSPENTPDYKIGYRHGATGRDILIGQTDHYKSGYLAGFLARMEGKK